LSEEEEGHGGKKDSAQITPIHNLMGDIAGRGDLLFFGMLLKTKLLLCHSKYPRAKVSDTLVTLLCVL